MVLTLSIALTLAPPMATVAFDQVVEVTEKLAKSAETAESAGAKLFFNEGSTILAGVLTQNGKFTWNFTATADNDYMVYKAASGTDADLKIEITTEGANAVDDQNEYGAIFGAKKGKRYALSLVNRGDQTFSGVAMFKLQAGLAHPISSIAKAAKVMAKSIDAGTKDGFKITPNSVTLLGTALSPGKFYSRDTSKASNWTTIATSDGASESLGLAVLNKSKEMMQEEKGEDVECKIVFTDLVDSGTIRIQNAGTKTMFFLSMLLAK